MGQAPNSFYVLVGTLKTCKLGKSGSIKVPSRMKMDKSGIPSVCPFLFSKKQVY